VRITSEAVRLREAAEHCIIIIIIIIMFFLYKIPKLTTEKTHGQRIHPIVVFRRLYLVLHTPSLTG